MKWLIGLVSGLVVLALVVIGLIRFLPTEEIARRAAAEVKRMTGRELVITGPIEAQLWPSLSVRTGPVSLANADWGKAAHLISAEGLLISLETSALLRGDVRVSALELISPDISLERDAKGQANWNLIKAESTGGTTGEGAKARDFSLTKARVSDGSVSFHDAMTGLTYVAEHIEAELSLPDLAGLAEMRVKARVNDAPFALWLQASPAASLITGGLTNAKFNVKAGGSEVDFAGSFGHAPLQAEGALHIDASDRKDLMRLLQLEDFALPQGFGASRVLFDGRATLRSDMRLALRDAVLQLDEGRFQLSLDVSTSQALPKVEGNLTALGPINLPKSAGGEGGGGAAEPQAAGWSVAPIDLSPLRLFEADLAFSAPGLTSGDLKLGAFRGQLLVQSGRASLTLSDLAAWGGRMSGTLVANAQGRGSMRADLSLNEIALQQLLAQTIHQDRLIGRVSGKVSVLSSLASVQEMMNRMQGEGQITIGKGELKGLDIAGMLRNLDLGYVGEGQSTIFDGITGSFSMADGIMRTEDLALEAPLLSVAGRGTVALGQRSLEMRLTPRALREADGSGGIAVPLLISGPWASLRYRLDLETATKAKLEAEQDRLEERAKQGLAERLGAQDSSRESLEDAARQKLENEVRRGLGRLFGN